MTLTFISARPNDEAVGSAIPRDRATVPAAALMGMIAAFAVAEGALRLFVTPALPPRPAIARDSFTAPAVETRQIEEGIATAHFSAMGARMTGNPPLSGAPTAVILGDSYVVAREVSDEETMGARASNKWRAQRVSLNIRQYGWRGASPAQYLEAAADVIERWNPAVVMITLSDDDFDERGRATTISSRFACSAR